MLASALVSACATSTPNFDAPALATELQRRPSVLLGEVHDNEAQHRVRAEALRLLLARGARPALAFEQIDRDRQAVVDAARHDELPPGTSRIDHLIAQVRSGGWDWSLYRPYLELALQYDLPIVAANLSRADATRVARDGYAAVFDADARARLRLDELPEALVTAQARAVDEGHCHTLTAQAARRLARAQIARDATLAETIRPLLARGVILFTGNGHARNDIGVPFFLSPDERARVWTIGLIEDASSEAHDADLFDAHFITLTQARPDPCAALRRPRH